MTATFLDLQPSRSEPVIWMRRVVILERLDPIEKLNEFPFTRGLNIVIGEEKGSWRDIKASGHGVGKTSLCRLIRYCLGEPHFGRQRVVAAIRQDLPAGWVGAELRVGGQSWSILRPFAARSRSRAARDLTVEALALQRPQSVPYNEFESALASALMANMPRQGQVVPGVTLTHGHLLPAFTRDQECRLESVWRWRSERSDSETPSLPRPKIDGSRVMRAILGVLDAEELSLQDELDGTSSSLDEIRDRIKVRLDEPRYWVGRLNRALLEQGLPDVASDAGELFAPANRVASFVGDLRDALDALDRQLEAETRELRALLAQIQRLEDDRKRLVATQGLHLKSADTATQCTEDERRELVALKCIQEGIGMCRHGAIPYRECEHVADHLGRLEGSQRVALPMLARSDQAAPSFAADIASIDQMLVEPRATAAVLERQIGASSARQRWLERRIETIEDLGRELDRYLGVIGGSEPDTELDELREKLTTAAAARDAVSIKLKSARFRSSEQWERVRRLYSSIIAASLSPEYSGEIVVTDEAIEFQIRRDAAIGGEAVESLAVVLADVCGLLASVEGFCHHPGFVLHDSPREADLGSALYQRFISFILKGHHALGGANHAPFQYILTTTTPPPPECGEVIRVRLSDDEDSSLLFRRRLGVPPSGLG